MNKLKNSVVTALMVASVMLVGGCNKLNNVSKDNENNGSTIVKDNLIDGPAIEFYSRNIVKESEEKTKEIDTECHSSVGNEEIVTYINTDRYDRESLIEFVKNSNPKDFKYDMGKESLYVTIIAPNDDVINLIVQRFNHDNNLLNKKEYRYYTTNNDIIFIKVPSQLSNEDNKKLKFGL